MAVAQSIEYRQVSAGYGQTRAVSGVSFTVQRGERWGVLGRNGAGKTTTLAAAVGLSDLQSGDILLDGVSVRGMPSYQRARAGLGYVPQGRDIFASLTVEENILSAIRGGKSGDALEVAYTLFPRLKERRRNGGTQLSGGEQQMLSIARAVVTRPGILLLDEPLEGLAPKVRQEVMESIARMASVLGVGCVLVEQYVDVVLSFCEHVVVLESGQVVYAGRTDTLRQEHAQLLENAIGLRKI